jgi:hypothetical protein
LLMDVLLFALNFVKITLLSVLHVFLDLIAIFFNIWIILDGLNWDVYIYIFIFCT